MRLDCGSRKCFRVPCLRKKPNSIFHSESKSFICTPYAKLIKYRISDKSPIKRHVQIEFDTSSEMVARVDAHVQPSVSLDKAGTEQTRILRGLKRKTYYRKQRILFSRRAGDETPKKPRYF
ncbi:hypothetical protein CEXT_297121 [Caerostris extrusa]|uniref:Uncharacterized protein n=1 Tax=Caerostris extrusa TaxID=172846 RepID=A0AAV4MHB4_CAEEX|nr:hypothetical protein CEXT_297121 [Caerostris extrusa]